MSRSKKSRKPGSAPTAKPKLSKKELESIEKRVRKHKGNKAGNRQQEASPDNEKHYIIENKDPRLGSKKPIVLIKETVKKPTQTKYVKATPITAVRTIKPKSAPIDEVALEQKLEAIEENPKVQAILKKQEQEVELSEQEVDFFNEQMDRHQKICELLGYDEESKDEELDVKSHTSEDDLWDKLDNNDFTKNL